MKTSGVGYKMRLDDMSDGELMSITRFPRSAIEELCEMLKTDIERETHCSGALPVDTQVLTTLQSFKLKCSLIVIH